MWKRQVKYRGREHFRHTLRLLIVKNPHKTRDHTSGSETTTNDFTFSSLFQLDVHLKEPALFSPPVYLEQWLSRETVGNRSFSGGGVTLRLDADAPVSGYGCLLVARVRHLPARNTRCNFGPCLHFDFDSFLCSQGFQCEIFTGFRFLCVFVRYLSKFRRRQRRMTEILELGIKVGQISQVQFILFIWKIPLPIQTTVWDRLLLCSAH